MRGTQSRLVRTLTAAALSAAAVVVWQRMFFAVLVEGESMTPELEPGDCILVRRTRLSVDSASGQVVCVHGPSERLRVKRVVGVPGDQLRVGAEVYINGRQLHEPYAHGETPARQYRGVNQLGPGEYFVIGDHRAASTDSRDFGPVRAEHVQGVAWLRYWPPARLGWVTRAPRTFAPPTGELREMPI